MVKRVIFVQKFIPHYRLPLFESLRDKLAENGIELVLIYGPPDPYEGSKIKMSYPDWGHKVNSKIFNIFGRYLYWQGVVFKIKKDDVVIVEQAAKLLDNYFLFFLQQIGFLKLCYFGHGKNFQTKYEIAFSRFIKKLMVGRVSRWFAYTDMSADALLEQGVDQAKICVVNNTLQRENLLPEGAVPRLPQTLLYLGGLYKDKRIDFLLEAISIARQSGNDLTLHIVGSGPLADEVEAFAKENPWCKYHGSLYGEDRDKLLYSSTAIVMPGLVGLIAVDAFHYTCPIITTNCGQHSPEFAYLTHGENAVMLNDEGTPEEYAALVSSYLNDEQLQVDLAKGCQDSADRYTIEDTADRFVEGIKSMAS